jgi:hypothetical protein
MPIRTRQIAREFGAAFAVLAIYMLVLLAPLHQMSGLQRELAQLGYESTSTWSVCLSVSDRTGDETPLAAKCPLAGVGKFELAALPVASADFAPERDAVAAFYAEGTSVALDIFREHPGQPRAPPALA